MLAALELIDDAVDGEADEADDVPVRLMLPPAVVSIFAVVPILSRSALLEVLVLEAGLKSEVVSVRLSSFKMELLLL